MSVQIHKVEIYKYNGQTFTSLEAVKTHIENHLGVIIDSFDVTLTPSQKLKIFDGLVKNAKQVTTLLNVRYDSADDLNYSTPVNILTDEECHV